MNNSQPWQIAGKRLSELLEKMGASQRGWAREIGTDHSLVWRWLKGERYHTPPQLLRVLLNLRRAGLIKQPEDIVDWIPWWDYDPSRLPGVLGEVLAYDDSESKSLIQWLADWKPDPQARPTLGLPDHHVYRGKEMSELSSHLCAENDFRTPAFKHMILWGMGGVGKTTLARALTLNEKINAYFRNGILWANLGPEADQTGERTRQSLVHWCKLLGLPSEDGDDVWTLHTRVKEALSDDTQRLLIILDDVWWADDVAPLLVAGKQSRVLLTTRETNVAQKLGWDDQDQLFELSVMNHDQAIALIRNRMGEDWQDQRITETSELADLTEYLPLALELGATVIKKRGWNYVLERLRKDLGAFDALKLNRAERRQHSLQITFDLSYENLCEDSRDLFEKLGMFPDAPFGQWDIRVFSAEMDGLAEEAYFGALLDLVEASLVMVIENAGYRMHTLVRQYAKGKLRTRPGAGKLWCQYIECDLKGLLDVMVSPESDDIYAEPPYPGEETRLMEGYWPHIAQGWREAQVSWNTLPLVSEEFCDDLGRGDRAMRWARGFGFAGCQHLWRQRDFEGVVHWATEAECLYRRGYLDMYGKEPCDDAWCQLLCWQIDGLFEQGRNIQISHHLKALQEACERQDSPVWQWQLRIRQARWYMLTGDNDASQDVMQQIKQELPSLAGGRLGADYATLIDAYEVLGEYAARYGEASEAERYWWEACKAIMAVPCYLSPSGDADDYDWWRIEAFPIGSNDPPW
jgi:predicted ATPase/transcriptional regulator with XRE-family HTH domain